MLFGCNYIWVFELDVSTLCIVRVTSFYNECSQEGYIVTPQIYKELENSLKTENTYFESLKNLEILSKFKGVFLST